MQEQNGVSLARGPNQPGDRSWEESPAGVITGLLRELDRLEDENGKVWP